MVTSLPLGSISAVVLLVLLLPAAVTRRASRRFASVAAAVLVVAGVAAWNVCRVELRPFRRGAIEVPEEAEAREIFAALHRNVYRAFDFETEDAIYDALARGVTGELLDDIYEDIYCSLVDRSHGGVLCRIENIEILRSELLPVAEDFDGARFRISCDWRVSGVVEHWSHSHRRVNDYSAVYTLEPVEGEWRISGVEMRDRKRVIGKTP